MTLEELIKVRDSLKELDADVEVFNWGPSLTFALQRKAEALKIINREIKKVKNVNSGTNQGSINFGSQGT